MAFAASLYQDPKVMRKIGPVFTRERAENSMSNAVLANQQSPPALRLWLITERETQKAVGIQMLKWEKDQTEKAEIGIMLLPKACKKRYGFESIKNLVNIGFDAFGLTEIFGRFHPTNTSMCKVFNKLNFVAQDNKKRVNGDYRYCYLQKHMKLIS